MTSPTHVALSRLPALPVDLLPGVMLCCAVALAAQGLQSVELHVCGRVWLEALVLAILLGTALRTIWEPDPRFLSGIAFCAKTLLECAVVLLGASISVTTVSAVGLSLLAGIAAVVCVAIAGSFAIGRALGLQWRLAVLVACGNSICGNSAIAAVAPVIDAEADDIAASIAFTAVLGVVVVLGLPLLSPLLHLSETQYGTLAGLTVYAVPQVLAATLPIGALSNQVGTLIKLVRVLMLGPVVLALSLAMRARRREAADDGTREPIALGHLVPWFIVGFLGLAALRSLSVIPAGAVSPLASVAGTMTVVSMAGLGLGVDVRVVARAGWRVTGAVILSLLMLGVVSLALIFGLHVP